MLEKFINISLRHRYVVVLVVIAIAAVGTYSFSKLPIDAVPDITNNQVQINTTFSAFSPVEIEKQVTFPIETALAGIRGLQYTRSLSRNGFSQVTAVFDDNVDIYFARQQVGERLTEAREVLPPGTEPKMGAISTGLGEVYMWVIEYEHPDGKDAVTTDSKEGWQANGSYLTVEGRVLVTDIEKAAYLREIQDWVIRPQLKTIPGVAGIDSIGGYEKHYLVEPDPEKLVAYGLSFADVIDSLENNNVSTGAGFVENSGEAFIVRAASLIRNEADIQNIIVGERAGVPIYIKNIARVGIGKELRTGSASSNGREAVVGTALMLIGENSRTVAHTVSNKLAEISRNLPSDIRARPVLDRTKLVDATIQTVKKNLLEGAILVIAVLFGLLGNFRAAVITALAIPLSMLITTTGMVQSKISGNLMSLGAIDFGLIVDGAVIVVENCIRKLADKQHQLRRELNLSERLHEVSIAAKEMTKPSVFGQAIIITVYVPILFLTGIEGKMFHPMAMTVIFALVGAFVLSLTFIPAMVALCITGRVSEEEVRVVTWCKKQYEPALRWSLQNQKLVTGISAALFLLSLIVFSFLGQEFVPTLDEKDIAMHAMRIPSTSLTQATAMQLEVERTLVTFPEVDVVFSKTGTAEMASDPMPPNVSDTFIKLKPQSEWPDRNETKLSLINRIQETAGKLPGNNYEFTQPIQMRFNELIAGVRSDVAIKIYGDDFEKLLPAANNVAQVLRRIPGASDVKVEQVSGLPILEIEVNRTKVSRLGLNVRGVQDVISSAVGGRDSGLVFEGDRRFALMVRLPENLRSDVAAIRSLPIPLPVHKAESEDDSHVLVGKFALRPQSDRPAFIPLEAIASVNVVEGPNQISRENGKRRIVVQANVRGRDIGSFVKEAAKTIATTVTIPTGYWTEWGGQFENLVAAKKRFMVVVPLCFVLILILLFGSLGSLRQSIMVFTGVPLALTGGIAALWLRDMPFSISAGVGFIALSGVAVLNGLVMVTCINQMRLEGLAVSEAVIRGAMVRLRPVLMTALVASLGFLPMAIASGTGAEVQKPIATVVIGGLISATALTLLVLPALYSLFVERETTPA